MRAAQFDCSVGLLADLLHMPQLARIIGAEMTDSGRSVRLTVDDPELPESPDPHMAIPTVTRTLLGTQIEEMAYSWDWGIPGGSEPVA